MDAKGLVLENTFTSEYDIEKFIKFTKEFFNNCTIKNKVYKDFLNWVEFKEYIKEYTHVASYTDPNKSRIAVFAVELKSDKSVERARSLQRNFISKLISNGNYDAAIVAFYSADKSKWRLSLVKLDYEFAKGRANAKLTPAKRYSYLVGEKEPCHTAMERLLPIFKNDKFNPTLDNIEEAFNVEKITEDFFKKYKEKYHELKDHLDNNTDFKEEANKHNFSSEQFAKKLMGQLAFLYFLQKKGWLGVKVILHEIDEKSYNNAYYKHGKRAKEIIYKAYLKNDKGEFALNHEFLKGLNDDEANILAGCFKSEPWGSGTKSFVRDLFNNCIKLQKKGNKNFFDEYLEPLFYEALNYKRGENNYYNRFNCKIPFLNGGLFEPLDNYDWENSMFELPNELFSNEHIKGRENSDGILDVFDRYNFTMNEDEPLEKEVAVDPEMLGKIFENLLDIKDRKSKGAYYTPREIVHYMCQESLINYLVNETNIPYKDVKEFITYGEIIRDEDTTSEVKLGIDSMKIPLSIYKNLKLIDDKLVDVKVVDPAVGSGAFPMGMISEIVKARNNITAYMVSQYAINNKMSEAEIKMQSRQRAIVYDNRNPYKLKLETIKNSICAVDIEASAVDITKLRLWLSLVVDEDLEPTYEDRRFGENKQKDPHPLPNLDCNIMCGDSLIDEFEGIKLFDESIFDKNEQNQNLENGNWQLSLFNDNTQILLKELFKYQDKLFGEDDIEKKSIIKKKIDKIIDDIIRSKLANDKNIDGIEKYEESLKQKTKPYFLWKLEFAKVFRDKGGFDIAISNPPYGADIDNCKKRIIKNRVKDTGNFNSAAIFMDFAKNIWIHNNGINSFIVPKSLLYSQKWLKLAKSLIKKTSVLVDVEKAFDKVKLEQVVYILNLKQNSKSYLARKFKNNNFINTINIEKSNIDKFDAWICDVKKEELEFVLKLDGYTEYMKNISKTKRGIGVQKLITAEGDYSVIGGRNIKRYKVEGIKGFLSREILKNNEKRLDFMMQPKIITQDLIAHMQNPIPHVLITSDFDEKGEVISVDTVQNTVLITNRYKYKYILGLLNSDFVSWYTYKFIYCGAIRTMHFDDSYVGKIPIPIVGKSKQEKICNIVDNIKKYNNIENAEECKRYKDELNNCVNNLYNVPEWFMKINSF